MKPSENLYKFTEKEEGCILHAYYDIASVLTIGVGCTYLNGWPVRITDTITQSEADALFRKEMDNRATAIEAMLGGTQLNQNQFDALCDFAFNAGTSALASSTLLKKVKACPSDPSIKDELLKWCHYHKNGQLLENQNLKERRMREAKLYFS